MRIERPLLILIVGPYYSGTDGDPAKIAANLAALEAQALPVYERGHLALIGEWLALPIIRAAGGKAAGDAVFQAYQYPVGHRLLARCDALLRIPGASRGADQDVALAHTLGLPVFLSVEDIPRHSAAAHPSLVDRSSPV